MKIKLKTIKTRFFIVSRGQKNMKLRAETWFDLVEEQFENLKKYPWNISRDIAQSKQKTCI